LGLQSEVTFGKRRFDQASAFVAAPARAAPSRPARPARAIALPTIKGPVCTALILVGLIVLFVTQETAAFGSGQAYGINYRSLLSFGGDSLSLVRQGQWWRLFTAPLMHANPGHLIGNGIALALVGLLLERLIGWGWFLAIFVVSALCGSLVSIYSQDPQMMGVGASGAIMGLLAASLVCSFHIAAKNQRIRMRWIAARIMIPALLPLGGDGAHAALHIDYSAHAGGAMAGVVMGLLINAVWPEGEPKPVLRPIAEWLGLAGLATAGVAFLMIAAHYPAYKAISTTLAPDALIPTDQAKAVAAADDLVNRYPSDPRVHFYRALGEIQAGANSAAADELKTALGETDQLSELPPEFAAVTQYALARSLLESGDSDAAHAAAAPICGHVFQEPLVNDALLKSGLCGAPPASNPAGS
jgi:rhomboid protease GluP